jgi:hypothetical protein
MSPKELPLSSSPVLRLPSSRKNQATEFLVKMLPILVNTMLT